MLNLIGRGRCRVIYLFKDKLPTNKSIYLSQKQSGMHQQRAETSKQKGRVGSEWGRNKERFIGRCLYLQYLENGLTSVGQDMLNSTSKNMRIVSEEYLLEPINSSPETYTTFRQNKYTKKIKGTEIEIEDQIPHLDDIKQNIVEFEKRCKSIILDNEWSDQVALNVVKAHVDESIKTHLSNYKDIEGFFQALLKFKYHKKYESYFEKKLEQVKQYKLLTIDEYHSEIMEIMKRLPFAVK